MKRRRKKNRDYPKEKYVGLVTAGWNVFMSAKNRNKIYSQRCRTS